jgi:hypothetical protein|tara:strand:+ start:3610 stop:3834 length:225 start_codon:yes stop_codon:yes gene_type:complete
MIFKRLEGTANFRIEFDDDEIKLINKQKHFELTPEGVAKFAGKLMGAAVEIRSEVYKINKDIGNEIFKETEVIK